MNTGIFFSIVLLAAVTILFSCVDDVQQDKISNVQTERNAGQFLNYVSAFNDIYLLGAPPDGEASSKVKIPDWLPKNSKIKMQVNNGSGYVYTPASPGLYSQLLKETENSSHFGLSDIAGINTPSGRLERPYFIPAGYVVYMR